MTEPKKDRKPGRPCIGEAPLTPAEKQTRYRQRLKGLAATEMLAVEKKSRVTLLGMLGKCLKLLEQPGVDDGVRDINQKLVAKIFSELETRYKIVR